MKNKLKSIFQYKGVVRLLKSLRLRIFLIVGLVGIIPILLMKMSILEKYEEQSIIQRGRMLQNQSENLADRMGSSVTGLNLDISGFVTEMEQLATLYGGRLVVVNREFEIIEDTYGLDVGKYLVSEEVIKCFRGEDSLTRDSSNRFVELAIPIEEAVTKEVVGALIVSSETASVLEGKDELGRQVSILQIGLIVAVLVAALYTSGILVKPFKKVTEAMEGINGGFLGDDLTLVDYTETQVLSEAYNRMLGRMKALDDSRQEFVSNVSHELKTPITSMKVLADSLLMQEDVPPELYKEFLQDIAEEIERENKIINDLLSLVKMDRKASDVNIQATNINELIELILKRLRPIAAKRNIELVLDSYKPVIAEVDETKLTLAISNLVENAVKYNREGGWVHLSINTDHKYFYVKVEDNGIGIPQADQEHIFERFYRVDKSHSREIGGTGLGLAIARSAIMMHRGVIKVYSEEGAGTTFTVRVPLLYSE
ncbi:ATPase/histidine kinase/DNA gyrase B/HSP90 domain protein [Marvinbryantia formatexigens DSM 14469]|uniref:histidine kinase n=1 Tax=Marvinbryantia formatexigens DSM 14469 TaxID=478749 RepID=C6LGM0_9FIRM|nr:ATP-binding protein [Marvinbryantia formatexigens]EET60220.1 ATPase/histidine kinase/DNA gyrase B/HSP90 domain protein [Marvinbryantia formatexigens DSM 14469]UWO24244.1 cell wall metabolism sensor histidine kinase WalK [Marvinbryantia formatexigens DSM 14469]SDF57956.1 His Kinase A (phospho-acceptor) domain-containing protein [Marvinbryantia formatexigens]